MLVACALPPSVLKSILCSRLQSSIFSCGMIFLGASCLSHFAAWGRRKCDILISGLVSMGVGAHGYSFLAASLSFTYVSRRFFCCLMDNMPSDSCRRGLVANVRHRITGCYPPGELRGLLGAMSAHSIKSEHNSLDLYHCFLLTSSKHCTSLSPQQYASACESKLP